MFIGANRHFLVKIVNYNFYDLLQVLLLYKYNKHHIDIAVYTHVYYSLKR